MDVVSLNELLSNIQNYCFFFSFFKLFNCLWPLYSLVPFWIHNSFHSYKVSYIVSQLPGLVPQIYKGSNGGLAFDCSAGLAAIRTDNYCVQLYSLLDDREISEVSIKYLFITSTKYHIWPISFYFIRRCKRDICRNLSSGHPCFY